MTIRLVRNPKATREHSTWAAPYLPGESLDELRALAARAQALYCGEAEVVEVTFRDGPILIVRYMESREHGPPEEEFVQVHAGCFLSYSEEFDSLGDMDEREMNHWYKRADS